MKTLLHLDSSLRPLGPGGSVSRQLTAEFAAAWKARHPEGRILHRDFALAPLPHLSPEYIAASYKPTDQRTPADLASARLADATIAELFAADHVLIGAPMYNFTVPSSLKTWVDHIVQDGTTFRFGPRGPEGLVAGKRICAICTSGGDYTAGSPFAAMDHCGPWLQQTLGFLGMTDFTLISVGGVDLRSDSLPERLAQASQDVRRTLDAWTALAAC